MTLTLLQKRKKIVECLYKFWPQNSRMLWIRIDVYHTQFSVAYFLVSTLLSKMFGVGDRDLAVPTSGN